MPVCPRVCEGRSASPYNGTIDTEFPSTVQTFTGVCCYNNNNNNNNKKKKKKKKKNSSSNNNNNNNNNNNGKYIVSKVKVKSLCLTKYHAMKTSIA